MIMVGHKTQYITVLVIRTAVVSVATYSGEYVKFSDARSETLSTEMTMFYKRKNKSAIE